MRYIDFHVHIDFYEKPLHIAYQYEQKEIYTLFVTNLPEIFEKHYSQYSNFKFIRLAIGYHPELIDEFPFNKDIFRNLVTKTNYIGEVGLDFSKKNAKYRKQQIEIFEYITHPEFNKGKIYSIHSKNSEDEVLDILKTNKVRQAVFHWYSGKLSTLKQIVDSGYYFSVNCNMLMSKKGQNILKNIPRENLLFETDGPFGKFEKKIVEPGDIINIYKMFDTELNHFSKYIFNNFKNIILMREVLEKK